MSVDTGRSETLDSRRRLQLLELAEASIDHGLEHDAPLSLGDDALDGYLGQPGATFVTVYLDGELDGCMGSLQARRPLGRDVTHNAFMAAHRDPRFEPVCAEDRDRIDVHISVLSPLTAVEADAEDALCGLLEPGHHGLLLVCGDRRGTLLPSVWEKCPDRRQFVRHVKRKAGLPADFWSDRMRAFVYTVQKFDRSTASPSSKATREI
jgi:uncharacterized protein